MGAIIDKHRLFRRSLPLAAFLALLTALPVRGHSTTDSPPNLAARPVAAVAEEITGTVNELVIEDRVKNATSHYYQLQSGDGTTVLLTGPSVDALQDGSQVALRGGRNGAHFVVDEVQSVSPPSSAEAAAKAAAAAQVEGMLAIAHSDDFATGTSQYHYHVRDDAGALTTLSAAVLPPELRGGMRVHVFGQRSADGSSLEPSKITILSAPATPGLGTTAGATPLATTTNSVLVILANFSNTAAPAYTQTQAQQAMVANSDSVANFYNEMSYGQQTLNVTVTSDWVPMNLAATCSYTSIASAANTAALALSPTYNASNYNFVVYLFTGQSCGWAGLAYVGFPHQAFINGTGYFTTGTIAHEMGHNFGLLHAGSLNCGSVSIGGSCSVSEYGDPWDTMGNQRAMHFNAAQKSLLNWIPASSVQTHTSGSSSYTLAPLETAGGSVYAVKIPTTNASRTYWLEFRQPLGFDAPLSAYPNNGVQVRVSSPFEWSSGADDTEIVDMTPGSAGGFGDSALVVGQSYLDGANGGVNIIVTSATASAVTVSVTKGGGAATTTTLSSSANPSTVGANVTFIATVTGTNPTGSVNFNDGASSIAGCTAVALAGSGNSRTAACTTNALAGGAHSIVASYSGDAANAGSSSAALSQTVNKVASTTGIATSLNPSTAGSSVSFTATVSGTSPTGTVNFMDGATSISGCAAVTLAGSGNIRTASCATASLAAGSHSISGVYSGDTSNNASTSAILSQVVNSVSTPSAPASLINPSFETPVLPSGGYQYNPSATGIGWTFSASSGIQGNGSAWGAAPAPSGTQTAFIQSTSTITQTLSLNAGSYTLSFQAAQRSGQIQPIKVTVDGTQIGSLLSPASTSFSSFSIPFSVATTGAHTITFTGTDPNDRTTFIDSVTMTTGGASTTTTLASSLNPSTFGANVTFTATVMGSAPTGSLSFTDGGSSISGCVAVALTGSGNTRTAQCSTSALTQGTHSIVVNYGGDANNTASASPPLSQVVNAGGGGTSINVALGSNGGVASASSTYSPGYPASAINNNERAGTNPGNGGYWNDATPNSFPDWVQINFNSAKTIDHAVVYSLQDNYTNPIEPTDTQTFSLYGVTDFAVQGWDGANWVTLGTVSGNNLVKRTVNFSPYPTDRIRINVTNALNTWSRITEVEAWGN